MPELRHNFFTKERVIIATERAKRPEDLVVLHPPQRGCALRANLLLLSGERKSDPPEILRSPVSKNGSWHVGMVPDRFAHSPAISMALMSDAHVADVLHIYKTRYKQLSLDPCIAQITIFKNQGRDAGTWLEHPHSPARRPARHLAPGARATAAGPQPL